MLCLMSSLLETVEGARRTVLYPVTTYGVQGTPRWAAEAAVRRTQPSLPYGQSRPGPWCHLCTPLPARTSGWVSSEANGKMSKAVKCVNTVITEPQRNTFKLNWEQCNLLFGLSSTRRIGAVKYTANEKRSAYQRSNTPTRLLFLSPSVSGGILKKKYWIIWPFHFSCVLQPNQCSFFFFF